MEEYKIPTHVAIILDGNGRWATEKGLERTEGHKEGFETLKILAKHALKRGIKILSVFAFSTENFKREQKEVDYLMNLFIKGFKESKDEFNKNNIRVVFSGREKPLKENVLKSMRELEKNTEKNNGGILNICLNYGGQGEIADTAKKIAEKVLNGEMALEDINETTFEKNLYNDLPPIDLLIRTSGEIRLSNFMLYEAAYAELYFPKTYFPDFKEKELDEALDTFNNRDRRFGGIKK